MKFLFASPHCLLDSSSGAALHVQTLLSGLARAGHQAVALGATIFDSAEARHIFRRDRRDDLLRAQAERFISLEAGGVRHLVGRTRHWFRPAMTTGEQEVFEQQLRNVLDHWRPDVVVSYGGMLLERAMLMEARRRGVVTVFNLVNAGYEDRRAFADVDLFITDSEATADLYRQRLGLELHPIGGLVDPLAYRAAHRSPEFVTFVNPIPEKGVSLVARLALMCRERIPGARFLIVESRGKWAPALERLGVGPADLPNCTVIPAQSDMRAVYARTKVLLQPSFWHESGGRVALEAMLNHIPAMVPSHGGTLELVRGGALVCDIPEHARLDPAALVDEQSAMPWFEQLAPLLRSPSAYAEAVDRARDCADRYDASNGVRRFLALVDRHMSARGQGVPGAAAA